MGYYREWAPTVFERRGLMLPVKSFDTVCRRYDPGYASVYMFNEGDALEILAAGNSKGLNRYVVSADMLVIDLDDGETMAKKAEDKVKAVGYPYTLWDSGSKGFHLCIPHAMVSSPFLPHSHLQVVRGLGIGADESLYQHGRLVSLPGRVHPKTKRRKVFVRSSRGTRPLSFPLIEPEKKLMLSLTDISDKDCLRIGLYRAIKLIDNPPTPGNRHTVLWGTAKDMANAGLPYAVVLELLHIINDTWEHPKTPEELELAVKQGFK